VVTYTTGLLEFQEEAIKHFGKFAYTFNPEPNYFEVGVIDSGLSFPLGWGCSPKEAIQAGLEYLADLQVRFPILWGSGPCTQSNNKKRGKQKR